MKIGYIDFIQTYSEKNQDQHEVNRRTNQVIIRWATVRTHWDSTSLFKFSLKCSDEVHPRLENI